MTLSRTTENHPGSIWPGHFQCRFALNSDSAPQIIEFLRVSSYPISAEQKELIRKNQRKLDRFKRHAELGNGLAPREALERLGKVGIEFPSDLRDAVLNDAAEMCPASKAVAENHPRPASVTRQLNKCRTMLIILAIEKLGCDPRKGCRAAGKQISAIAERLGITIDEDTARRHLADGWSNMKPEEMEALKQAISKV